MKCMGTFKSQVIKLLEVVLRVEKGDKFSVQNVNSGQGICSRVASVGNCEKQDKGYSMM